MTMIERPVAFTDDPFEMLAAQQRVLRGDFDDLRSTLLARVGLGGITCESATVAAAQSTTSTSYTDLATVGPTVTLDLSADADVLVWIVGQAYNSAGAGGGVEHMGFAVSGATTISADDTRSLRWTSTVNFYPDMLVAVVHRVSLNAGANVLTAKYRAAADQATFSNRSLHAIPTR